MRAFQSILVLIVYRFQGRRKKSHRWRFSPQRLAGYLTLATATVGLVIKLIELRSDL